MRKGLKFNAFVMSATCLVVGIPGVAQAQARQPSSEELRLQGEALLRQAAEREVEETRQRAAALREAADRESHALRRAEDRLASLDARSAQAGATPAVVTPTARAPLATAEAQPPVPPGEAQSGATDPETSEDAPEVERQPLTQERLADSEKPTQTFGGIEFGVGMAFSLDLGDRDRVRDAQLVNGIVRVSRGDNVRARLILESHYFFTPEGHLPARLFGICNPRPASADQEGRKPSTCLSDQPMWGWGPFIAVQPGSDNIIDAIGAGLMVGLRRPGEGSQSFNIGVGILYDMDAQLLGDGIFENEPLPPGETEIRYRREAQSGLMVMSSYSF